MSLHQCQRSEHLFTLYASCLWNVHSIHTENYYIIYSNKALVTQDQLSLLEKEHVCGENRWSGGRNFSHRILCSDSKSNF